MKESDFIEQNKQKWSEFEKELKSPHSNPERIANHYIETIEDLSYARTHYPNRLVRAYLNGVAQAFSLKIHRSQKRHLSGFRKFWARDLPLVMYEARMEFLLSFLILAVSVAIGILSSIHDPAFAGFILGDDYVATTLENIEKGDPMAIYKDPGQTDMFLAITFNNIMVSAYAYSLSLFFGAGTLLVIMFNGVMLGVFQYFFIERGLFFESFLTIWQHGVVEISCIVLAGAAGLVLARGILFPGTLSRINAFRYAGRKSLVVMLGLMPLLIYSGAIEAAVTRYTEMHWVIRLSTILLSLAFVLIYFVFYPRRVARRFRAEVEMNMYMQPMQTFSFSYSNIAKNAEVVWKSFGLLHGQRKAFLLLWLATSGVIGFVHLKFSDSDLSSNTYSFSLLSIASFFHTEGGTRGLLANFLLVFVAAFSANWFIRRNFSGKGFRDSTSRKAFPHIILASLISAFLVCILTIHGWLIIPLVLVLPVSGLFITKSWMTDHHVFAAFRTTFPLLIRGYGKLMVLVLIHLFTLFLFGVLAMEFVFPLIIRLITGYFEAGEYYWMVSFCLVTALSVFLILYFFTMVFLSLGLSYFSLNEIHSAEKLKDKIRTLFPTGTENEQKATMLSAKNLNKV